MAPIFLLIISGLEAFARAVFFIDDAFFDKNGKYWYPSLTYSRSWRCRSCRQSDVFYLHG